MGGVGEIFKNDWWRFSAYEIEDGYIRPRADATLSVYDPWRAYVEAIERDSDERPYRVLQELADSVAGELRSPSFSEGHLSEATTEALLSWVCANGLLGLGLQRTEQVEVAPRWLSIPSGVQVVHKDGRHVLTKTRERLVRTPGGWSKVPETDALSFDGTTADASREGRPLSADELPSGWSAGSALMRERNHLLVTTPIEEKWAAYFPGVGPKATYRYPTPLSDEFWQIYAEPVREFVQAALELGTAAKHAARLQGVTQEAWASLDGDAQRQIEAAVRHLEGLANPVTPQLAFTQGGLQLAWISPSLLSLYAMMILLDLTSRTKLHSCEECQGLFLSPSPLAAYCSKRCRWKSQKRAQRKRQRDGKTDRSTDSD